LLKKMKLKTSRYNIQTKMVYANQFGINYVDIYGLTEQDWFGCREYFAEYFDDKRSYFFFSHKKGETKNIAAFFNIFEKKLKLNKKSRSKFYLSNNSNVTVVNPSRWWRQAEMRRQLFTILLRSAVKYDTKKRNFEEALFSYIYAKQTKAAILRFLKGYTYFKYDQDYFEGFRDYFQNAPENELEEILIKPPKKTNKKLAV